MAASVLARRPQSTEAEFGPHRFSRFLPRSAKRSILFTTRNQQVGFKLTGSGELTHIPHMDLDDPNGAKTQLLIHTNTYLLLDLCILVGLFDKGY
jgi:hypothetical protein